jgi:hypothetical protein
MGIEYHGYETTLEELGRGGSVQLEVDLEVEYLPGEKMVRYYADGSGYPGSDAEAEIVGCRVLEITGDTYRFERSERPEYFAILDEIAHRHAVRTLNIDDVLEEVSATSAELLAFG